MISDRRTPGIVLEDESIEWKTRSALRERFGANMNMNSDINIAVTSFNRNVLLTGQVPSEAERAEAGQIAAGIDNVNGVVNEIELAVTSTLTQRSNDALIGSRVKARFVDEPSFAAHHVKVITEMGVVYLMGIVTRREADAATEVARTTQGVQKVVRVFEFVSDEEAVRLDRRTGG